ncbi:DUF3179 domain-containing protein [Acidimicrobiaceae bacterium AH-315-P05]|nr:DUF3179 domain-containing protein [Acidimicrobiaceae bacterium AH-315-P05]
MASGDQFPARSIGLKPERSQNSAALTHLLGQGVVRFNMHGSVTSALFAVLVLLASCSSSDSPAGESTTTSESPAGESSTTSESSAGESEPVVELVETAVDRSLARFGPAPDVPTGPLSAATAEALDRLFGSFSAGTDFEALAVVAEADDARIAWLITDTLRFTGLGSLQDELVATWESLTGTDLPDSRTSWGESTDHLIAWDLPAPPGYIDWKSQLFELVEPGWAPFFDDPDATIDWRWVSWGGVLIDDRPIDDADSLCQRGCIPALNDPALTDAAGGAWYADDAVVFGVEVNGAAVAFPKNIMEVHEMTNMNIGGRRIAMPYCTLCGSAQAYFTDDIVDDVLVDGAYELRTSGLLSRSNKVMFELQTRSVFDTFTGEAVTGPLREAGVWLEEISVRTSTWGDWKALHPDTKIVAEDGGIGRTYRADPLNGRDDDGPIFPIGNADGRLGVQEAVLGIVTEDGVSIAFPVEAALTALNDGQIVAVDGIELSADAAGLAAFDADGTEVTAHQSFWFAWSQFHPDTLLWAP